MKLFGLYFSAVLMFSCCSLLHIRGHGVCQREAKTPINVTTGLQSEILLPCQFDPDLFTVNLSAVWTQINTTVQYIVEIAVNGHTNFWNNRGGRVKTVSGGSTSGNFSILIDNVQRSDLGLYRCEIFRDIHCSLGYGDISLSEFSWLSNWPLIVAGGGGGFLLVCLVTVCVYYIHTKRQTTHSSTDHRSHYYSEGQATDEVTYASVAHKSRNCHDSEGQTAVEVTYASVAHKSRTCHDSEVPTNENPMNGSESEHVSSETVLYAAVKQRDRR